VTFNSDVADAMVPLYVHNPSSAIYTIVATYLMGYIFSFPPSKIKIHRTFI
jgi:hypothetical protein